MANRFRMAIRNTGEQILSAGKQEEALAQEVINSESLDFKEIETDDINEGAEAASQVAFDSNSNTDAHFLRIALFLKQKVSNTIFELRLNKIREILDAIIDNKGTEKPVMIRDYKANIDDWIEAIKSGVPEGALESLSFNTYESESMASCQECIIYVKGKVEKDVEAFRKNDDLLEIFDFTKITNNKTNRSSKYAEFVQVGYLLDDTRFHEFKAFFDQFEYKNLDSNIDNCLKLFYFTEVKETEYLDCHSIEQALDFAAQYGNAVIRKNLFEKVSDNININKEMAYAVIRFMLKAAKADGEKEYYKKGYKFIFDYIQQLMLASNEQDISSVYDFYNTVKTFKENEAQNFIAYGLNVENASTLSQYVTNGDSKFASFYLSILLQLLSEKGDAWKGNLVYSDIIEKGIDILVNDFESMKMVIHSVEQNAEYVANLILTYYMKVEKNEDRRAEVIQFYSEKEELNKGKNEKDLRSFIILRPEGYQFIFDEFKVNLIKATNKSEFFWQYKNQIFDKIRIYKNNYFSEAIEFYLSTIRETSIYKDEWTKILNMISKNEIILKSEVLVNFIEEYENEVPLIEPDIVTLMNLKNISRIKQARNIVTSNANSLLMEYGQKLKGATSKEGIALLINNRFPDLKNITDKKLEEFLEWCLDLLVNNSAAQFKDIYAFYNKVMRVREEAVKNFAKRALSSSNLSEVVDTFKPKKIQFYLRITLDFMLEGKQQWNINGEYEMLIKSCIGALVNNKDVLEQILQEVVEYKEYFAGMLAAYGDNDISNEVALSFFKGKAKERGEEWVQELRTYIAKNINGDTFLYEEFIQSFELASNKSEFFWNYIENVFKKLPSYKLNKLPEAFQLYIIQIEKEDKYAQEGLKVLKFLIENAGIVEKDILREFIAGYENTLLPEQSGKELEEVVDQICNFKKENDLSTIPDVMGIISFSTKLKGVKEAEALLSLLTTTSVTLKGIREEKYSSYIDWCLPLIGEKLNFAEYSNEIANVLYFEEFNDKFFEVYNDIVFKQINSGTIKLTKESVQTLVKGFNEKIDLIAKVVTAYFSQSLAGDTLSEAVEIFVDVTKEQGRLELLQIRKTFSEQVNGNQLLFEEYKYRLEYKDIKHIFFFRYWKEVFNELAQYKKEYFIKAVEVFLESIKTHENYPKICYDILKGSIEEKIDLSDSLLLEIISASEKLISIGAHDGEQQNMVRDISLVKSSRKIITIPDIIGFIDFGTKLNTMNNAEEVRQLVNNSELDIKNIDYLRYDEWLEWCLPKLINSVNSWQMHAAIRKVLCADNLKGIFFTKYIGILADELGNSRFDVTIFTQFILYFINGKDQFGDETYFQGRVNIINALFRCNEVQFNKIDKQFKLELSNMKNKDLISKEWEQIQKKVTPAPKQEKGFFKNVRWKA